MGAGRSRDLREAAMAAIRGGPLQLLPVVIAALVIATGGAAIILTVVPSSGGQPALNEWVRGVAAGLCALIGVGYLVYRARSPRARFSADGGRDSDPGVVTAVLSLAVLSLLLLISVYLLVARTHE